MKRTKLRSRETQAEMVGTGKKRKIIRKRRLPLMYAQLREIQKAKSTWMRKIHPHSHTQFIPHSCPSGELELSARATSGIWSSKGRSRLNVGHPFYGSATARILPKMIDPRACRIRVETAPRPWLGHQICRHNQIRGDWSVETD
jgi:hypothetical protein